MKRIGLATLVGLVLFGFAYLAGQMPERQRASSLESQMRALQDELAEARARSRRGALLAHLLLLTDHATERNYGQAQPVSSSFFDAVQAEAGRTPAPEVRRALESILALRDRVTAALTQGDPTVVGLLHQAQLALRDTLWSPPPMMSAPASPPAAASPAAPAPSQPPSPTAAPRAEPAPAAPPSPA